MARAMMLRVPDGLVPIAYADSVAVIRGKTVHLRTDAWAGIDHIGYHLFNREMTKYYHNERLFDFVERYLLELDLGLDERGSEKRMHVDGVTMVKGSLDMLRRVTPDIDLQLSIDEIKRKIYRLTWVIAGQEICMSIPANSQLLLGANAIELEEMAARDLPRMRFLLGDDVIQDWSEAQVSRAGKSLIVKGGIYMSNSIRGDLYLTEHNGLRRLVCSPGSPTRSISNIMLTGLFPRELPVRLVLNRYGNKHDTLTIALQQWIAYGRQEGCKFYFGIKSRTAETLTGTLFAYNEKLAYVHMLSVSFPLSVLTGGDAPLQATAYVYIPLQHIADKYFIDEFNPMLYDED